ncbi:MAG: MarR family transcriptional regulator [Sporolactobacillus sp.]
MELTENQDRDKLIAKVESNFSLLIRRFRRDINEVHGDVISAQEYLFLSCLSKHEPETASGLAKHFDVSPSYTTIVVDKLIRNGWVDRRRSQTDRRIVELTMTADGTGMVEKIGAVRREFMHQIFDPISDQELSALVQLTSKLI